MAAKKASKKVAAKKADSKKTEPKSKPKADKALKAKEPKVTKDKVTKAKVSKVVDESPEAMMETPSTLVSAAEKEPAKKKRMTKKQLADQTERSELTEKWAKLKDIDHEAKAQKYKMSDVYEPNTPVEHPVFGWGFILSLNENKLEVLFESGIKMLVSNFKG